MVKAMDENQLKVVSIGAALQVVTIDGSFNILEIGNQKLLPQM
jgi:hypothetical protein